MTDITKYGGHVAEDGVVRNTINFMNGTNLVMRFRPDGKVEFPAVSGMTPLKQAQGSWDVLMNIARAHNHAAANIEQIRANYESATDLLAGVTNRCAEMRDLLEGAVKLLDAIEAGEYAMWRETEQGQRIQDYLA